MIFRHTVKNKSSHPPIIETVAGTGILGSTQYQLNEPARLTLDSNNNFYISDVYTYRILFWTNGANFGTVVGPTGGPGSSNQQLNLPYGVGLHPATGRFFVIDTYNNRAISYEPNNSTGTVVLGGIGAGTSNTQLNSPRHLYMDLFSNSLFIANSGANNIVEYTLGASAWTLKAGNINGSPGHSTTELNQSFFVTLDPMGNMYVADRNNHRIQFFYLNEFNGITIAGVTGVTATNATTLNQPSSVTLDSQLNLYVADTFNYRVQKFQRY